VRRREEGAKLDNHRRSAGVEHRAAPRRTDRV